MPYLVQRIDKHNTDHKDDPGAFKPNLKGFMVGNGVTNWKYDTTPAYVEMAYWHGLYDDALYHNLKDNCDLTYL